MKTTNILLKKSYRELFDARTPMQNKEGEVITQTVALLKGKHENIALQHNQGLVNTFGSILIMLNPNGFGLIDTLGGGSLGATDIEGESMGFIMGYCESVSGHGVRYLNEYGVIHNGKTRSSGPLQYRGAYANEKDNWDRNYQSIKILEQEGENIIIGVGSGRKILIQKINTTTQHTETIEIYDLVQEAQEKEKNELAKTLQTDWRTNIDNIKKLVSNKYDYERDMHSIDDIVLFDTFAIIPVHFVNRKYDAEVRRIKLFIVGDNNSEPKEILNHSCNHKGGGGSRFYSIYPRFDITQDADRMLNCKITYRFSGERGGYDMSDETVKIKIA